MKTIFKVTFVSIILIGLVSFSKPKTKNLKTGLNNTEMVENILNAERSCRPFYNKMFYVETSIVKKSRGFNRIRANLFVLDRISGISTFLTNEDIIVPKYKDSVLKYDITISEYEKVHLKNGHLILVNNKTKKYDFCDLLKYEVVYNSYIRSTNNLLTIERAL